MRLFTNSPSKYSPSAFQGILFLAAFIFIHIFFAPQLYFWHLVSPNVNSRDFPNYQSMHYHDSMRLNCDALTGTCAVLEKGRQDNMFGFVGGEAVAKYALCRQGNETFLIKADIEFNQHDFVGRISRLWSYQLSNIIKVMLLGGEEELVQEIMPTLAPVLVTPYHNEFFGAGLYIFFCLLAVVTFAYVLTRFDVRINRLRILLYGLLFLGATWSISWLLPFNGISEGMPWDGFRTEHKLEFENTYLPLIDKWREAKYREEEQEHLQERRSAILSSVKMLTPNIPGGLRVAKTSMNDTYVFRWKDSGREKTSKPIDKKAFSRLKLLMQLIPALCVEEGELNSLMKSPLPDPMFKTGPEKFDAKSNEDLKNACNRIDDIAPGIRLITDAGKKQFYIIIDDMTGFEFNMQKAKAE